MERKKKICKGCGNPEYIWARGKCKACDYKDKPAKPLNRTKVKPKISKPTGELVLFQSIFNSRRRACVVCNEPITTFDVWNFSHVLPKSTHPEFRLYDKNIMLKCRQHHHDWETKAHSDLEKDDRWTKVLIKEEVLREEYALIRQNLNNPLE
jgi:hypothetical protein